MTRQWAISYELAGRRGRLFFSTITRAGALQGFRHHFPTARVVRVSEVPHG